MTALEIPTVTDVQEMIDAAIAAQTAQIASLLADKAATSYVDDQVTQEATARDNADEGLVAKTDYGQAFGPAQLNATSGLVVPAYEELPEIAAPDNPVSGKQRFYLDSTTRLPTLLTAQGTKFQLIRHRGQGTVFPTASLQVGDRFINTLYADPNIATQNGYSSLVEFVWTGYQWSQVNLCLVANAAARDAMTASITAAAPVPFPGAPGQIMTDGFEVMETAGNRRYQWFGSGWQLIHSYPAAAFTSTSLVTPASGWTVTSVYLRDMGMGYATASVVFTKATSAFTVAAGNGDVTNTPLGTVNVDAWRPLITAPATNYNSGRTVSGYFNTVGELGIASLAGDGTNIAVGDVIQLSTAPYRLADPLTTVTL